MRQDLTFTASELLILGIFNRRISSMLLHWDTFKARLDKCWSARKFICTKLDTKQMKTQNKDYLEGNDNIRPTERP